ncbi:hypothetical protein LTR70_002545 [Exophiala xenobiotica]|uniref:Carbonyl reductase n=1 Tax=Lithohypha guttulata TaxID=1690604 RepID=A0ABR0KKA3_9EURO|nr:hypothetical protein LTR24_001762 [Lithohypha guttulata]KAK5325379.1 hypothetical protein LTR70_002545 [Exophiala xenobiotica]
MSSYSRIAAVTGGNKGVGLACVRQLALKYPQSSLNNGPFLIYLTARNQERGEKALNDILQDLQLKEAKALQKDGGLSDVKYLPLDIDSQDSIKSFAATLKKEHPEGIDILLNNAGVALDGFDASVVKKTLHCNYYGTMEAVNQILPQIKDGGRIVNVASIAGTLDSKYAAPIRQRFLDAQKTDEITALMEEFTTAVEKNQYEGTWPGAAYKVSKAGVIGMTKTLAMDNARTGSKTLINSCCPGYVNTDMTKGRGAKTPDEGAQTPVLLALGDIEGSNANFWYNGKITPWER